MRILFLVLCFSLNAWISLAQNATNEPSAVPLKRFTRTEILAGPSIITIRDNSLDQYQRSVVAFGYAIGLGKAYTISNHFKIIGRIFYERKGDKHLDAEQIYDPVTMKNVIYKDGYTVKDIYTCISVPITLGYTLGRKAQYQFEAGPFLSYTLAAAIDVSSSISNYKDYNDMTKDAKPIDFGFTLSFGTKIPFNSSNKLSVNLMSNWGIPNVLNLSTQTWRTYSLILLVGYPISNYNSEK
ncbi:MAG TPA: porin family protein [Cyclobacteriaceae bacterium]|nr:porin family protein [Cyclobacteriaceae bacterium]